MRKVFGGLALLGGLWIGQASALTADDQVVPYVGVFGSYEFSDAKRDSDNGYGFQTLIGYPITDNSSLEFSFSGLQRKRHSDSRDDFKNSISLDYLYDFGFHSVGNLLPEVKPYLLAGLIGVQEDVLGSKTYHPGVNGGGGLLFPLRIGSWDWGWAVRTEARVFAEYNDHDTPPANRAVLVDYHVNVGLQIPLSIVTHRRVVDAPALPDCPLSVVDPVSGRKDCVADSDHDGVPDVRDECPGTAEGVQVNDRGCPIETGGDADGDGVLDTDDQCPNTAAGIHVDAKGCAIDQTLILQGVTFENDSAVLTASAAHTLDLIAESLNGQGNTKVEISGHTDNVGADAYNLVLSQQRAESVRQYLIGKGVDGARLTTQGYGKNSPIESNATERGRQANRRVEFKIMLQ